MPVVHAGAGDLDRAGTLAVRVAAGRVAAVDRRLGELAAEHEGRLEAPVIRALLSESRRERGLLMKSAKAAVDAGVADRLVKQVELNSAIIVHVFARIIDAAELPIEWRVWFHEAIGQELRAMEEPSAQPELPARLASMPSGLAA